MSSFLHNAVQLNAFLAAAGRVSLAVKGVGLRNAFGRNAALKRKHVSRRSVISRDLHFANTLGARSRLERCIGRRTILDRRAAIGQRRIQLDGASRAV